MSDTPTYEFEPLRPALEAEFARMESAKCLEPPLTDSELAAAEVWISGQGGQWLDPETPLRLIAEVRRLRWILDQMDGDAEEDRNEILSLRHEKDTLTARLQELTFDAADAIRDARRRKRKWRGEAIRLRAEVGSLRTQVATAIQALRDIAAIGDPKTRYDNPWRKATWHMAKDALAEIESRDCGKSERLPQNCGNPAPVGPPVDRSKCLNVMRSDPKQDVFPRSCLLCGVGACPLGVPDPLRAGEGGKA